MYDMNDDVEGATAACVEAKPRFFLYSFLAFQLRDSFWINDIHYSMSKIKASWHRPPLSLTETSFSFLTFQQMLCLSQVLQTSCS